MKKKESDILILVVGLLSIVVSCIVINVFSVEIDSFFDSLTTYLNLL